MGKEALSPLDQSKTYKKGFTVTKQYIPMSQELLNVYETIGSIQGVFVFNFFIRHIVFNKNENLVMSQSKIAEDTGINRTSVGTWVKNLEDLNLIVIEKVVNEKRRYVENVYHMTPYFQTICPYK